MKDLELTEEQIKKGVDDWVGYYRRQIDGERKKSPKFRGTKREMRHKAQAWLDGGGFTPPPAAVTVGSYLQGWYDGAESSWQLTTRDTNRSTFTIHVLPAAAFLALPLTAVGYQEIEAFLKAIDGTPNTKKRVTDLVSQGFERAVRLKLIPLNPFKLLEKHEKPKKSKSRITVFTTESASKLIAFVNRPRGNALWRGLIMLGFDAGPEPEELLGLQIGDFSVEARTVHFQRTVVMAGKAGRVVVCQPTMKAEKRNRVLEISSETMESIRPLLDGPQDRHVFSPGGSPWSYKAFYWGYGNVLSNAGVAYLPPLTMRHTMATRMLSRGRSLAAVSKRLGHSSFATTLNFYTHALPEDASALCEVSSELFALARGVS